MPSSNKKKFGENRKNPDYVDSVWQETTVEEYQDGSSNLVATVWQDNRIVRLVSTNSNPRNVVHTDRRLGHNVIQVNLPQNIQLYNRYMNGVDCHDQMCMKYDVGHFCQSMEVHPLVFCEHQYSECLHLYCKTSTRQTKKMYTPLDFWLEIAVGLIAGFSSRKRKAEAPLYIGPVTAANENNHENEERNCIWMSPLQCTPV